MAVTIVMVDMGSLLAVTLIGGGGVGMCIGGGGTCFATWIVLGLNTDVVFMCFGVCLATSIVLGLNNVFMCLGFLFCVVGF